VALTHRSLVARILYGGLFVVVLPLGLVGWAISTADVIRLPAYQSTSAGIALLAIGILLMALGVFALGRYGAGLPMNLCPPPSFVDRGIYRYLGQPIYVGFGIVCAGAALIAGSASGLWLITPAAAAGSAALVLGYERPDLRRRFGGKMHRPLLSLPPESDEKPGLWDRVAFALLVLLPWVIAYEAVQFMGIPRQVISSYLWFEHAWPVLEWTEVPYASVYILVFLTPFIARTNRGLRHTAVTALLATAVVTGIYLTVPLVAPPRPFQPQSWMGLLLAKEKAFNHTVAAFPAFHVLWALIAAAAWPAGLWRRCAFLWALIIAAGCLTTGMHSLADVGFALILFPALHRYPRIWKALRLGAERLANSWREWRIGPVRAIIHGIYPTMAGIVGMVVAGILAGPAQTGGMLLVAAGSLAGAGLWAQWLEGSPALLRPFGFYGGLAGGLLGSFAAALFGYNLWLLLGAFAVALPWIQALGRLRCLVQGCCHGGSAPASVGIRYNHPRSRVTQIAGLSGLPLHPTPLYSILSNIVIGTLLARLWSLSVPPAFVVGMYFLLNGLTRFVEESYRAEPQTPGIWGLHIYHWFATACIIAGMAISGIDSTVPAILFHAPEPGLFAWALVVGLCAGFAMGVDFPGSNRRFSRLAAVGQIEEPVKVPITAR
jgi:protein-S-isoprenylcysteine O-methyltransferase Ste14